MVLEALSKLKPHTHYEMPAISPTAVTIFIPVAVVLGIVFAIW